MPRYDYEAPLFAECELCGSNKHLCISVPIPRDGKRENMSICIMCAKRVAKAYTRFIATAKSRSYTYWYRERKKLQKAGLNSGLEAQVPTTQS